MNDKAQVLLPKNWVPRPELLPPGVVILSNTLEDSKLRGMEIVGAPVGGPRILYSICCQDSKTNATTERISS